MLLLPAIGIALNGTSSVLYGTVAELVPGTRKRARSDLLHAHHRRRRRLAHALRPAWRRDRRARTFAVIAAVVLLVLR